VGSSPTTTQSGVLEELVPRCRPCEGQVVAAMACATMRHPLCGFKSHHTQCPSSQRGSVLYESDVGYRKDRARRGLPHGAGQLPPSELECRRNWRSNTDQRYWSLMREAGNPVQFRACGIQCRVRAWSAPGRETNPPRHALAIRREVGERDCPERRANPTRGVHGETQASFVPDRRSKSARWCGPLDTRFDSGRCGII
jgi:hypothetical protein